MSFLRSKWRLRSCGVFLLSFLVIKSPAAEKRILLRNETIVTSGLERQSVRAQSAQPAGRALYLLQLKNEQPADWRAQLEALRVDLLRPVPEDAFVVELEGANFAQVESLPFVQWLGPFRPEYKVHSLVEQMIARAPRVRIAAVLSPKASSLETALLQRQFQLLRRYHKNRFGRVLEGDVTLAGLSQLKQSKAVLWIEPAAQPKLHDAVADQIIGGEGLTNGVAVHQLGFDGKGVAVAVADSGLNLGEGQPMHPDLDGRVDAFFFYGSLLDASDEHGHGTHVSGIIAGNGASGETDDSGFLYGLGVAPKAHIIAQRIFDGVGGYEPPDSMAQLTTDAIRAGAVIGSNSWGDDTQGRYDSNAMEFDALVRDADPNTPGDQPYILEFSAGNAGPGERTIGSPAVAKNVIATGASQNNRFDFIIYADGQDSMADFSSRGPCEDGRIKPDLVAPGTWISSLQSQGASDENAWAAISSLYQYEGGTSQAGPHASGSAAVFVQYYRETHGGQTPSPALVKAALINSAADMDNSVSPAAGGTTYVPNNDEGWGRIDLTQLIGSDRKYGFIDQTTVLTNGQVFEQQVVVATSGQPLKITLTYTDVPGFPAAIPALVNDLDLEVISPSGTVFRGNQFLNGESVPDAGSSDSINNVEAVHIAEPEPGEYIVRVLGRKIVEDARKDTVAVDQDFALVYSGDLPLPGQGVVAMDRKAYRIPAAIQLKLVDFDLAHQSSATILLRSGSQTNGLPVVLLPHGSSGVFTGVVQTAALPVAADGRLHVQHGDVIEGVYEDASPAAEVKAVALADLVPPVITNVGATNRFGKEQISWTTDEPARTIVFYRTNGGGAFLSTTNTSLVTDHELALDRLTDGQVYQYYVVSTDEADNRGTNDASGALYKFTAHAASPVLLVNAYTYTASEDRDDIEIPVTSYTDALDRTGIAYEVWDVQKEGSPTLDDLKPFRVVIWRINDSFYEGSNTITDPQQGVITKYLDGGGAFMLASMDILTRLGPVAFRTNVLQVATFVTGTPDALGFVDCPTCDEDHGVPSINGADGESLTYGMALTLDYSFYPKWDGFGVVPDIGPDLGDVFGPSTNAVPIFFVPDGKVAGIRSPRAGRDSSRRVVFLSFPLDALPLDDPAPNNRANVFRSALSFLAPGVNGFGSISLDSPTYSAPSLVTVEVADSDLIGKTTAQASCRNYRTGEQISIDLKPTVSPGLFRGNFTLVATNQPAANGRLRVADGDVVTAEYLDASANSLARASADVDTGAPVISGTAATPEYESAQVAWNTDEATDALIQYGESAFLGKTVYDPVLSDSHTLQIDSLVPDKTYYYQVVSRDSAGNTTVDDNNGKLYSFRTLKPLLPPWSDSLEKGNDGWSVQDGDQTDGSWQLGKPNNDLDHAAHSGDNAWGTNLNGESRGLVQTYLVSPAVELKGGNVATLTFWHDYDFATGESISESGTLLLFTNTLTQPITLSTYGDSSGGWVQEEFDLTPYLGGVVHLVWEYDLIDFEQNTHPGWLLDDVEVTVSMLLRGAIQITNNLAAASFSVDGPTSFTGTGRSLTRSNVVTGQYVITYSPVPYYITPQPQTNTVPANGSITFHATYSFPDANQNGISDLWEQEHFQQISPARTPQTDSDGDGMTDLAEFIAGTDPLDAKSSLVLAQTEVLSGNRVKLTWPSVAGKTYTVSATEDGKSWHPFSSQLRASSAEMSFTFVPAAKSRCYLFRVEVNP